MDELVKMMSEMTEAVKKLIAMQERLTLEQQKQAKALGEAGVLISQQGLAIIEIGKHIGLNIPDGEDSPPQVN